VKLVTYKVYYNLHVFKMGVKHDYQWAKNSQEDQFAFFLKLNVKYHIMYHKIFEHII